jgi:chromosome segregation ATPase
MTDSQLQGQISIVEYLQKALAEARSVPAVILPPISTASSEVAVESKQTFDLENRLAQELSGLRSKLSQQEQQIESLQQIESKLAKENSEMAHKIESLKRMNTSLQEVITQYKRSQEVRVEVNREQLLQKEQLAHQNSILKSQKSFLVEENNFKAKEQEYKEKLSALETKIKNLEKENLLLVGEIDRKQDVINSVKGESIKHKQSAQKLTKERNHLKDQLKVKEKELIDALTSTEDKKEDHRTSVHTKGDATNGNMCQNHEQTIKVAEPC